MSGSSEATLVVDLGTVAVRAAVISEGTSGLVPEPVTGVVSWPAVAHWDGHRATFGIRAVHAGSVDPDGFWPELKRGLTVGAVLAQGSRTVRPVDLVTELLRAVAVAARHRYGVDISRSLLTVPASCRPGSRYRASMIAVAEAAELAPVELLPEPVAAACELPAAVPAGSRVLVGDLGAGSVDWALVGVGEDPQLLGTQTLSFSSPPKSGPEPLAGLDYHPTRIVNLASRLLHQHDVAPADLAAVLLIGGQAGAASISEELTRTLGHHPQLPADPGLAVLSGAVRWLARRGTATLPPESLTAGTAPLAFAIPGGRGQLVRWLVGPGQRYGTGAVLARVRVPDGGLWDLTAAAPGTLDRVLVGPDAEVTAHQWLALATP